MFGMRTPNGGNVPHAEAFLSRVHSAGRAHPSGSFACRPTMGGTGGIRVSSKDSDQNPMGSVPDLRVSRANRYHKAIKLAAT
jgi:hypothetical protein